MWKRLDGTLATSAKHAELSDRAHRVWTHLLPHTDAAGRFSANGRTIKARCLPMHRISPVQIERAVLEMEQLDSGPLVHTYDVGGERYLVLHDHTDWNPPYLLRDRSLKFPTPVGIRCKCMKIKVEKHSAEQRGTANLSAPQHDVDVDVDVTGRNETGGNGTESPPPAAAVNGEQILWEFMADARGMPGNPGGLALAEWARCATLPGGIQRRDEVTKTMHAVGVRKKFLWIAECMDGRRDPKDPWGDTKKKRGGTPSPDQLPLNR